MRAPRCVWILSVTAVLAARASAADTPRPNFLFIYTDDQRWDALGVVQREQGDRGRFPWFQTPNIDRIAAEGVRFRNPPVEITAGANRGGYACYFHDPDGITLELLQRPDTTP